MRCLFKTQFISCRQHLNCYFPLSLECTDITTFLQYRKINFSGLLTLITVFAFGVNHEQLLDEVIIIIQNNQDLSKRYQP